MSLFTLRYKGYTIQGAAAKSEVTYQSPSWPADPRLVKAPSLNAARGRINEETRRIEKHGLKNAVYLAKAQEETTRRNRWRTCWRIINADKEDLVQPYFRTIPEAREFCEKRGWALLEHFDY